MCQVSPNCDANPFTDASHQSCKKRPRSTSTSDEKLASPPSVNSPVSVDAMQHYNLRIKRVRPTAATVGPAFSQASPYSTSSKVKTRPSRPSTTALAPVSVSRDLNGEVKMLQRKVLQMQEQVKDAADGIRQLRQLVGVLAMQHRRAAMLAAHAQSVVQC